MKIRRFYPAQVLRRLQGDHADLSAEQMAVLSYLTLKSKRLGLSVVVGPAIAYGSSPDSLEHFDDGEAGLIRVKIFGGDRGFTPLPLVKAEAMCV